MDFTASQDDLEKRIELSTFSLPNLSIVIVRTKLIRLRFNSGTAFSIFLPFLTSVCNIFPNTDMHNPPWFSLAFSAGYNTLFHSQFLEIMRHFKSGVLYTSLSSSDKNRHSIVLPLCLIRSSLV
jgi:hypothetical protein